MSLGQDSGSEQRPCVVFPCVVNTNDSFCKCEEDFVVALTHAFWHCISFLDQSKSPLNDFMQKDSSLPEAEESTAKVPSPPPTQLSTLQVYVSVWLTCPVKNYNKTGRVSGGGLGPVCEDMALAWDNFTFHLCAWLTG